MLKNKCWYTSDNGCRACCALQTNDVVGANSNSTVHSLLQDHDSSFIYSTRISTPETSQDIQKSYHTWPPSLLEFCRPVHILFEPWRPRKPSRQHHWPTSLRRILFSTSCGPCAYWNWQPFIHLCHSLPWLLSMDQSQHPLFTMRLPLLSFYCPSLEPICSRASCQPILNIIFRSWPQAFR